MVSRKELVRLQHCELALFEHRAWRLQVRQVSAAFVDGLRALRRRREALQVCARMAVELGLSSAEMAYIIAEIREDFPSNDPSFELEILWREDEGKV